MASVFIFLLPILLAITLHEAAHGFVALRCGDDTALRQGRVTLNPFKHIDPVGTVFLPLVLFFTQAPFLFGYAKPVPVNFSRLRHPRRDTVLVALAGPATNFFLAFLSVFLFQFLELLPDDWIFDVSEGLNRSLSLNVTLGLFNLLPLLPLDGGRVLGELLPLSWGNWFKQTERWGMFILIGIAMIIPLLLSHLGIDFNPLFALLNPLIQSVTGFFIKIMTVWNGH